MIAEAALQELIDREAIRKLIARYVNASDRKDQAKLRSLYHLDAIDDHGVMSSGPAVDFIEKLPEIQAPMEILHHAITTMNIEVEGEYAEGEIYVLAVHRVKGPEGSFDVTVGGRYFDKYEKRDGEWKYLHHRIVADWAHVHEPSIIRLDHPMLEGAYIGRSGPDDPSYDYFRLIRRG
jgi:ketosteroid isomerase-like protein